LVVVALMVARWRKLLKSFYNEKKQQFDISKVPDIYDSAKYDAIHNSHLQLTCLKVRLRRPCALDSAALASMPFTCCFVLAKARSDVLQCASSA
jgi:hypothetical protein